MLHRLKARSRLDGNPNYFPNPNQTASSSRRVAKRPYQRRQSSRGQNGRGRPTKARCGSFHAGAMVVVTLGTPREKFWGAILDLTAEGLSLRGIELASFEDLVAMVKDGEPFSPGVVFFPMHRVERMELDLPDGSIPSLSQRFTSKTGLDPAVLLTGNYVARPGSAEEPA